MKTAMNRSMISIMLITWIIGMASGAQEVDPFYHNLLKKGEQSFLTGDYLNAIKNLEIACFGIRVNKKLNATACVYLGLSYFYTKNQEKGGNYLREAEDIMAGQDLDSLDIKDEVKFELKRLLNISKSEKTIEPEGLQALPRVPEERVTDTERLEKDKLEKEIKSNSKNVSAYYELYTLYRVSNNLKEAKKTIEELVNKNPREVYGYYMLGIILFKEGEYGEAESNFEKFFRLSRTLDIRQEVQAEIRAFQILSLYYQGKRDKIASRITQSGELLKSNIDRIFNLSSKDKIVILGLLEKYSN